MREVVYSEKFLKDLKKPRGTVSFDEIKNLCFSLLPQKSDLTGMSDIKKMDGFKNYFRIRIGDYRVGLKVEEVRITIMRVLHRKDIYKYFP